MHRNLSVIKKKIETLRKSSRFTLSKLITNIGDKRIRSVLRNLDEQRKLSYAKTASILGIERHSVARLRKMVNLPQLSKKNFFRKGILGSLNRRQWIINSKGRTVELFEYKLTPELAYLMGYVGFGADGYVNKNRIIVYGGIGDGLDETIKKLLSKYGKIAKLSEGRAWKLVLNSRALASLFVSNNRKRNYEALKQVLASPFKYAYLAGLIDAEGTIELAKEKDRNSFRKAHVVVRMSEINLKTLEMVHNAFPNSKLKPLKEAVLFATINGNIVRSKRLWILRFPKKKSKDVLVKVYHYTMHPKKKKALAELLGIAKVSNNYVTLPLKLPLHIL